MPRDCRANASPQCASALTLPALRALCADPRRIAEY